MLRELCRLHGVPLPSEVESLSLPAHMDITPPQHKLNEAASAIDDSDAEPDADEIEDATLESDPESEVDEDLSLDMDDGRNANKVSADCNDTSIQFYPRNHESVFCLFEIRAER